MPKLNITYCIVPKCINTTRSAPGKYFFGIPKNTARRSVWIKKCRRKHALSQKSNVCVCEDHFAFREDLENYLEWRLTKCRPRLKKSAVPSRFACQGLALPSAGRVSTLKRKRKEILEELLKENEVTGGAGYSESLDGAQIIVCSDAAEIPANERPQNNSDESDALLQAVKSRGPKPKETHYRSKGIQVDKLISEKTKSVVDACISSVKFVEKKIFVDDVYSSGSSMSSLPQCVYSDWYNLIVYNCDNNEWTVPHGTKGPW